MGGEGQHPVELRSRRRGRWSSRATGRCRSARRSSPIATTSARGSGFAYTLTPETVLRGGYGVSYVHFHRAGGANVLPINGPQVINAVVVQTPTQAGLPARRSRAIPTGLTDPSRFNPLAANITYMPEDYHSSRVQSWFVSVQRELWTRRARRPRLHRQPRRRPAALRQHQSGGAEQQRRHAVAAVAAADSRASRDITYSFNGGKSRYHAFQGKFDWRIGRGLLDSELADAVADQGQRRRLARERQRQLPGAAELLRPRGRLRPRRVSPAVQQHDQLRARPAVRHRPPLREQRVAGRSTRSSAAGRSPASTRIYAGETGDADLHAHRGVPGVRHSAGLPRREQLSAERHRRSDGAERSADGAELVQPRRRGQPRPIRASRSATRRATPIAGRSVWQMDFAASKRFPLPWRTGNLEFRAEFFNLFNRTNFRAPNGNISQAAFGTITAPTIRGSNWDLRRVSEK